MLNQNAHLSDEELILAADDELSIARGSAVRAHLSACWTCRARMLEIQQTIADIVRVHRENLERQPIDYTATRTRLKARLAELSTGSAPAWAAEFFRSLGSQWGRALAITLVLLASVSIWLRSPNVLRNWMPGRSELSSLPNPRLTPGAVRSVTMAEVCSLPREEVIRAVPTDLEAKVLREYGLHTPSHQEYEVDYLITPGLGGAEQIGNLWPEPYSGTWNAHLKDMLEERLHEMVCDKQIALESAQHEIATDWIAAYKKYIQSTQSFRYSPHGKGRYQRNS